MTFTTPVYDGATGTNSMITRTLTPDGSDTYSMTKAAGVLTSAALPGNAGTNLRNIAWPTGTPLLANTQVAATWMSRSAPSIQEGTAHRIRTDGSRTRCITVTKNVIYDIFWVFNVHTWDTSRAGVFEQIAQFDMGDAMFSAPSVYRSMPWRACTQVQGDTLNFKIWFPLEMGEPTWSDTTYARSTTLPADWNWPGRSGWYAGHIPPGGNAQYGSLGIWQ